MCDWTKSWVHWRRKNNHHQTKLVNSTCSSLRALPMANLLRGSCFVIFPHYFSLLQIKSSLDCKVFWNLIKNALILSLNGLNKESLIFQYRDLSLLFSSLYYIEKSSLDFFLIHNRSCLPPSAPILTHLKPCINLALPLQCHPHRTVTPRRTINPRCFLIYHFSLSWPVGTTYCPTWFQFLYTYFCC